ncbi:type II secretion system protein GspM [Allopusillimonas ginsengisoli]|uniref:type II secretion system protein GspM n=1 Tax=Allopusillimonas ginsengisoli TaxID=453575 RepID=UPI001020A2C2|nr:type II secretion system protein GspM [Allopusillimonas ginsengisoli]TEA80025.1 type II secretion system protein M [Allopusillimonas ginsengisoli]
MTTRRNTAPSKAIPAWRLQLAAIVQRAHAWWQARTSRERKLLRVGAIAVAGALVWTQGIKPALDAIALSREDLPRLHAQATQINALIVEAQGLARSQTGKIDAASMPDAIRASLERAGLAGSATVRDINTPQGESGMEWEIVLTDADVAHVMTWLAGLPSLLQIQTQAVALERASIDGRDRPGRVAGTVRVKLPTERKP